jgi:hypothetical protein
MAFLSKIDYTTQESQTDYAAPKALLESDLRMIIDEVDIPQTDGTYPWSVTTLGDNSFTVVFDSAPAAGLALRISRDTDKTGLYKIFSNAPLNATDLNQSFRKILYIEQEAYDVLTEVSGLFAQTGNVPNPGTGEENDYMPITEGGNWVVKGPTAIKIAMDLDIGSDVQFSSVTAPNVLADNFTVDSVSATTMTFNTIKGDLTLSSAGSEIGQVQVESPLKLSLKADNDIQLKVGDATPWRFTKGSGSMYLLTNYDPLPAGYNTNNGSIILSGTDSVVTAANTPNAFALVSGTTDSPYLTSNRNNYNVSSMTKTGTGDYTLKFNLNTFADVYYIPTFSLHSTSTNFIMFDVFSTSTSEMRVKTYNASEVLTDAGAFSVTIT